MQTTKPMWERFVLDDDHPSGKPVLNGVHKTDCFLKLREYEKLGSIQDFRGYKSAGSIQECRAAIALCNKLPPRILKAMLNLVDEIDRHRLMENFASRLKATPDSNSNS